MSESDSKAQLTPTEWRALVDAAGDQLSDEERMIAELLAQEKTQAAIAVQLGLHRSAVWRRAKAMATRRKKDLSRTETP
jgi:DNA-binding CsgD family transcriptional regulator